MFFKIVEAIREQETIATGSAIRELKRLQKAYGVGPWRKCKGKTRIELGDGTILRAEVHWYEAHGIGKMEFKIKRFLDDDETSN